MSGGAQLAVMFVPWAICGMLAGHARDRSSTRMGIAVACLLGAWSIALVVLFATGVMDTEIFFG